MIEALKAIETIQRYDALIARAILIVTKAPYWKYLQETVTCRLGIYGDEARLMWSEIGSCYDSDYLTVEQIGFPARLLILSEPEFEVWQSEEKIKYDEQEASRREARIQAKAAEELALLDALKKKHGLV